MTITRDLFGQIIKTVPGECRHQGRQMDFLSDLTGGHANHHQPGQSWLREICKAMSDNTNDLYGAAAVGQRWSILLRRRYPGRDAAKRIASELGHDPRTVQSWLAGQAPSLSAAIGAAHRWRDPLVLFTLAGLKPPGDDDVDKALSDIRCELDRLASRLDKLRGGS